MIEIQCQCAEKCGSSFMMPEEDIKKAEHYGDLLISMDCPDTNFDNVSIIEKLSGFVVISAPKETS